MHLVMHALMLVALATPPVDGEAVASPGLGQEFRAAMLDAPWQRGLSVDVLGGFCAFPSTAVRSRINMDRFAGVRVGYHRPFRFLTVGPELAWRSTNVVNGGSVPFWPLAAVQRLVAGTPQQVLRQENQVAAGGLLGARWQKAGYQIEGHLTAGTTVSAHTVAVTLERVLPYNRSFVALGAYAGAGFMTGLDPLFLRMDLFADYQVGPPPFGTRRGYLGYNLAAGVHW